MTDISAVLRSGAGLSLEGRDWISVFYPVIVYYRAFRYNERIRNRRFILR